MKILHLVHDEKFIRFVHDLFVNLPSISSRFVVHVQAQDAALKYTGGLNAWRVVESTYFRSREMEEDLEWCDCLLIHYLTPHGARMILKAPDSVVVAWSGWGQDYYQLLARGGRALLCADTNRIAGVTLSLMGPLRGAKRAFIEKTLLMPAIKRVNLFSAPIPDDFLLLRKTLGSRFCAEYVQLNYGSVEETFNPGPACVSGTGILVGNSATATNNHLEIFKMLATCDLGDRKVFAPLSYGDASYRRRIIECGQSLLGDNFAPIVDFLPLAEYNRLIAQCSVVIMNHQRQQALGNICTMLYKGARVFLSRNNVIYTFLRRNGAHVFCLDDLQAMMFSPLGEQEKIENKKVLEKVWGGVAVKRNAIHFLEVVDECRRERA